MGLRVGVVTDAVSSRFIFPVWHRYYAGQFGAENLFVITYAGCGAGFRGVPLGGLIELPVGYEDNTRLAAITPLVASLLSCYDVVIRVDADEFLVVDPRVAPSLAAFVAAMDQPYLTARGFDVIQLPDEPALPETPAGGILQHRAAAYPNTALNKTAIVRTPLAWSAGFHSANVFPRFGALFMLHMKRLDIGWQMAWLREMSENIAGDPKVEWIFKEYNEPDLQRIGDYHRGVADGNTVSLEASLPS
ncbi:MAG: hypothetical protein KGK10_03440 [Rhodospirillales bacterium]|nr:hypothetical protein [Rhodospirillales bacterium]